MKLSIITLTYNNLEYTKKFLESLYKYTKDFELIIVDNGSSDGTKEYLQGLNLKLISNNENKGFPAGNNQGLEIAEGEYIGFLNNDILLYPNWFEEIEKVFMNEKTASFVSPVQVNPNFDKVNEHNYIRKFIPKNGYRMSFDDCSFSCVITKNEILQKIGKFDENYSPAFFEDNDLKYRAIEQGFDTYIAENVCFFHFDSVTSKKLNLNYEKNRNYYYKKYPFAEYLSLYSDEHTENLLMAGKFKKFPLNLCFFAYTILIKIAKRLGLKL